MGISLCLQSSLIPLMSPCEGSRASCTTCNLQLLLFSMRCIFVGLPREVLGYHPNTSTSVIWLCSPEGPTKAISPANQWSILCVSAIPFSLTVSYIHKHMHAQSLEHTRKIEYDNIACPRVLLIGRPYASGCLRFQCRVRILHACISSEKPRLLLVPS